MAFFSIFGPKQRAGVTNLSTSYVYGVLALEGSKQYIPLGLESELKGGGRIRTELVERL